MICKVCNHQNEESISHCSRCHSLLTDLVKRDQDNRTAYAIRILSYIMISFGTIMAIFLPYDTNYNGTYDFLLLVKLLVLTCVVSLLLFGYAEIIDKLHRSEKHHQDIVKLLEKKIEDKL